MVFEQKFGFSVVVFWSHAAISLWFLLFFRFFGSEFFLNGFPNPFTALSRPSFLFELNFHSPMVFCSHAAFWHCFFFWFFSYFLIWFFKNGFLNSLVVHSSSSFSVYSMKILWIVRQDLSCYVFLFRRHDFCYNHMTSQPVFVHSFMQFQQNCMCDVIFCS